MRERPPSLSTTRLIVPEASLASLWAEMQAMREENALLKARVAALEAWKESAEARLPNFDFLPTEALLFDRCIANGKMVSGDGRVCERTAAWLLGITPESLRNKRRFGDCPPWFRVGGCGGRVTYRLSDIAKWMDAHRET